MEVASWRENGHVMEVFTINGRKNGHVTEMVCNGESKVMLQRRYKEMGGRMAMLWRGPV